MMLALEVRPTNELIRKDLKEHPIRRSHKLSKCSLANIARRTTRLRWDVRQACQNEVIEIVKYP